MTKIGAHVSIAGGIQEAPPRAKKLGCETFQCFTRSPQGGRPPPLDEKTVKKFKAEMVKFDFETFYIHTPYYINLASLKPAIRFGSIKVVREELERGSILGARYVMTHLGSYSGQTLAEGINKVTDAIKKILEGYQGQTKLLLEISAGAGNIIGDTFDEMGEIISRIKEHSGGTSSSSLLKKLGGICFDTCHAFASGYDFITPQKAAGVLKELDKKIGLEYLKLTHVNDSKFSLGQRKDRHEHIGLGYIGQEGLAAILQRPELQKIDWILETDDVGRDLDIKKLKEIRG